MKMIRISAFRIWQRFVYEGFVLMYGFVSYGALIIRDI
jgi:hypothetical protein